MKLAQWGTKRNLMAEKWGWVGDRVSGLVEYLALDNLTPITNSIA